MTTTGYEAVMHVHTVEIEVTCSELLSVMDAKGKHASKQTNMQANDRLSRLHSLTHPLDLTHHQTLSRQSLSLSTISISLSRQDDEATVCTTGTDVHGAADTSAEHMYGDLSEHALAWQVNHNHPTLP